MRRIMPAALVAALFVLSATPAAAAPKGDGAIQEEVDAYIVAHPLDFEGIDALNFRLRGEHIVVAGVGTGELTASEAASLVTAAGSGDVIIMGGIPAPQIYITKIKITNGVQFWGTWDFPDAWAGQGSPKDIAATTVSVNDCARTQNQRIWTYAVRSGQTYLGSLRQHNPDHWVAWNVADYVTNFENQADRGTTRLEVVRTSACTAGKQYNVGAAFDYEGNRGSGSIGTVSISFGFFSVSYSGSMLSDHWGADAIWQMI